MGTINRKPVAVNSGGPTNVYLKSDPGQSFSPQDRGIGDAGNYRTVGPILTATSGDRVFTRVRIPLRATATGEGSPSLGKTLTLTVVNATPGSPSQIVLRRHSVTITQDMNEAVFEGPFTVPSGQQHAYVYGVNEDGWSTHLGLFYGTSSGYAPPYTQVSSMFGDGVTPGVGENYPASNSPRSRAIVCEADSVVKNVNGPLDASDFPVVTALDQLAPGQTALLDNGVDAPSLWRRRLNGTLAPGLSGGANVSQWPVFIGNMDTDDAVGTPPVQSITGPGFQRLNILRTDDPRNSFVNSVHTWVCPEDGLYHIEMKLRLMDGTPPGIAFGYGADLYPRDSPAFLWTVTHQARQGAAPNQRLMRLTAGQEIVMFMYWDGTSPNDTANMKSAELTIVRIR